tara:strand:+ start:87 stop:617 length:531 start_codon:yes stop_codon:yes gene_type:complete
MATLKSLAIKGTEYYGCYAYIYRNGINLSVPEKYKGRELTIEYFLEGEIRFSAPVYNADDTTDEYSEVQRVVLSGDNVSWLAIGRLTHIQFHNDINTPRMKERNLHYKRVRFDFHPTKNGKVISVGDQELCDAIDNDSLCSNGCRVQGRGVWKNTFQSGDMPNEYVPDSTDILLER